MNTLRLRFVFFGLALVLGTSVAPAADNRHRVPVQLTGTTSGSNYSLGIDGMLLANQTNSTIAAGFAVVPGVPVQIQAFGSGDFSLNIQAPAGFTVYVSPSPGEQATLPVDLMFGIMGPDYTYDFVLLEDDVFTPAPAGAVTRLAVADFIFELGLGTSANGRSAGRLRLRDNGILTIGGGNGFNSLVPSSIHVVAPPNAGVTRSIIPSTNDVQFDTSQVRVTVIQDGQDSLIIRFFAKNSSGSVASTPFATYLVYRPVTALPPNAPPNAQVLRIVEQQGAVEVVRHVFRHTDANAWTRFEGEGDERRVSKYVNQTVDGDRVETVSVETAIGTVVTKDRRRFRPYLGSELLVKEEIGVDLTTGPLVTLIDYYLPGTSPIPGAGDLGKVRRITAPNGFVRDFDYYDDDDRFGEVQTVTESWYAAAGSSQVKVTSYDYTGPDDRPHDYPTLEEVKIGGATVQKTTHSYNFLRTSPDSPNHKLVERTTTRSAGSAATEQSTAVFYNREANYAFAGRLYAEKAASGVQRSYRYEQGTLSGSTFTPASSGTAWRTTVVEGSALGGTSASAVSSLTIEPIYLVTGKSTLSQIVRDGADKVVTEKVLAFTSGTTFDATYPIANTTTSWQDSTQPLERTYLGGTKEIWSWGGTYLQSQVARDGTKTLFAYDTAGRVKTRTLEGLGAQPDVVTTSIYNIADRVVEERTAAGGLTRLTTYVYDAAGRLVASTASDGRTTTADYLILAGGHTVVYEVLSCGGTRLTESLPDGKTLSVTGTAAVPEYHAYSVNGSGQVEHTVRLASAGSPRWRRTTYDWLGRAVELRQPGYTGQVDFVRAHTYDARGLLARTTTTGYAPTLYLYDNMAGLTRSGLDVNNDGQLLTASGSTDRLVEQSTLLTKTSNVWWRLTKQSVYPSTTARVMFTLGERLTGFTSGLVSETYRADRHNNQHRVLTYTSAANKLTTVRRYVPGVAGYAEQVVENGLVVEEIAADGRTVEYTYDALRRRTAATDSRTGTTLYTYYNSPMANDRLHTVTDPTGAVVATYTYDDGGRVDSVRNASGYYTYFDYDCHGWLLKQWGSATTPVSYSYNAYGERTQTHTYRGGTPATWSSSVWPTGQAADTTTRTYHEATGLLQGTQDALGRTVDYTYNERGQVATRQWSRLNSSSVRVTTTYNYGSVTGDLTGQSYNDGTPGISFTYDRLGRLTNVSDVAGGRTFTYDSSNPDRVPREGLPSYFGSRRITYDYESAGTGLIAGRLKGYRLGTSSDNDRDLLTSYTFDSLGRLATVAATSLNAAPETFAYAYEAGSSLVSGLANATSGFARTLAYDADRDLVSSASARWGATEQARYDYTFDAQGRRASAKQGGAAFADYGDATFQLYTYTSRGELAQSAGYLGAQVASPTQPLPGRIYDYAYDTAGNRTESNRTGVPALADGYTVNALNQITGRENNTVTVSGTVNAAAGVIVNGQLAGRQGAFWSGEALPANTAGPVYQNVTVKAAIPGTPDLYATATRQTYVAAAAETLTYDLDGNLLTDGRWVYQWDAENRLKQMETSAAAIAAGLPGRRITFAYDYQGRRIAKRVYSKSGSTWTSIAWTKFIYDGWNVIAELNASSSNSLVRTYAWGLDLGGTLHGMGGIGAMVRMVDHTTTTPVAYNPGYDGSGNVGVLLDSGGVVAAAYEYGPFGEPLRKQGSYAAANPWRYSGKYTDDESGLVYYGHRYYSPTLGRFINRDPIGEQGGTNLYGFVGNDPLNHWDYLGLTKEPDLDPRGLVRAMEPTVGDEVVMLPPFDDVFLPPIVRPIVPKLPPLPTINVSINVSMERGGPSEVSSPTIGGNLGNSIPSAPKKPQDPKCPELIAQAGRITGRMNETLSDQNVVESNIRFGEAVSVAHMVTSEGVELGTVVAKGFSVIKNVFTLGGYMARGAGTLGVGGTVIRGVPGTAAGDLINASIGNQQLLTVGGAVAEETLSTGFGVGVFKATDALFSQFTDARNSGRGAVDAAYSASAALQRSYFQDAQKLKDVRAEIKERGCGGN